jgi:hypothetical protein
MTDENKNLDPDPEMALEDLLNFMEEASAEDLARLADAAGVWLAKQVKYVRIDYKEALMFASGFVAEAEYDSTIFCGFPSEWVDAEAEEAVAPGKLEEIFRQLYGAGWRYGNEDGSRYLVLRPEIRALSPAEEQAEPWRHVNLRDKNHHYWFFKATDAREIIRVQPTDF